MSCLVVNIFYLRETLAFSRRIARERSAALCDACPLRVSFCIFPATLYVLQNCLLQQHPCCKRNEDGKNCKYFLQHHLCCKIFFRNNTHVAKIVKKKNLQHHLCCKRFLQHNLCCKGFCNTTLVAMMRTVLDAR